MENEDDLPCVDQFTDAIKVCIDLEKRKLKRTVTETISVGASATMKKKDAKISALSRDNCKLFYGYLAIVSCNHE